MGHVSSGMFDGMKTLGGGAPDPSEGAPQMGSSRQTDIGLRAVVRVQGLSAGPQGHLVGPPFKAAFASVRWSSDGDDLLQQLQQQHERRLFRRCYLRGFGGPLSQSKQQQGAPTERQQQTKPVGDGDLSEQPCRYTGQEDEVCLPVYLQRGPYRWTLCCHLMQQQQQQQQQQDGKPTPRAPLSYVHLVAVGAEIQLMQETPRPVGPPASVATVLAHTERGKTLISLSLPAPKGSSTNLACSCS